MLKSCFERVKTLITKHGTATLLPECTFHMKGGNLRMKEKRGRSRAKGEKNR